MLWRRARLRSLVLVSPQCRDTRGDVPAVLQLPVSWQASTATVTGLRTATKQLVVVCVTLFLLYQAATLALAHYFRFESMFSDEPGVVSLFHNRIPPGYKPTSIATRNDHLTTDRPVRDICAFVPSPVAWRQRRLYVSVNAVNSI